MRYIIQPLHMIRHTIVILLLQLVCCYSRAQLTFSTRVLHDSLFIPWELVYGPDHHIWFTQKNGFICRMDTGGLHIDTLYHEPSTVVIKESGMLGMALHPDFNAKPYVYVVWEYRNPAGNIRERLQRYTYYSSTNTMGAPFIILDSTEGFLFHNGSRIVITGDKLFVTIADASNIATPQNLNSINGKILRLNLDGSIPADNPLPGSPIWSWGHRNPQGLVYANGRLYSSEHGPESDDEINIIEKGRNYGWPFVKGFCDLDAEKDFCNDSNVAEPIQAWTPPIAPCGLDFYHHPMFPTLQNSLILATLRNKHLYQLQLNDAMNAVTSATVISGFDYGRLRDICISPEGKIYVSTSNSNPADTSGRIDRIIVMYDPDYDKNAFRFGVYPNPTADYLHFFVPTPYNGLRFIVTTTDGRICSDFNSPGDTQSQVYLGTLPAGTYFLYVLTDQGEKYRARFVKNG